MTVKEQIPAFKMPEGGTNLTARYAQYNSGVDAKKDKPGKTGHPIHGRLLGIVSLPSVLPNAGPWEGIAVRLHQACPVTDINEDGDKIERAAAKGEVILLTVTTALESALSGNLGMRLTELGQQGKVAEVVIIPKLSRVKSSGLPLWIYPTVRLLAEHKRMPEDYIGRAFGAPTPAPMMLPPNGRGGEAYDPTQFPNDQ